MFPLVPADQLTRALDACAEDLVWETGFEAPPIDAWALARRWGAVVVHEQSLVPRARCVRLARAGCGDPRATILVGRAERPERSQWAVAHEMGELVAHQVYRRLSLKPTLATPPDREKIANELAMRLLLPRTWFARDGRQLGWDLLALKQTYATASHELIARRMLSLQLPVVMTLCDQGVVAWRRSNWQRQVPPLSPTEQAVWQRAHDTGEAEQRCHREGAPDQLETLGGVDSVSCWPIHEPHWRREIIRAEAGRLEAEWER